MTSRIHSVTFDCHNPLRVAEFWAQALGYGELQSGDGYAWVEPSAGIATPLLFVKVPESKRVKNRVHLDIETRDQAAEIERLISLGARIVDIGTHSEAPWTVMADPEGNEFCVSQEDREGA